MMRIFARSHLPVLHGNRSNRTTAARAASGENPVDPDMLAVEERDDPVVEDFGGGQRRLARIELGEPSLE